MSTEYYTMASSEKVRRFHATTDFAETVCKEWIGDRWTDRSVCDIVPSDACPKCRSAVGEWWADKLADWERSQQEQREALEQYDREHRAERAAGGSDLWREYLAWRDAPRGSVSEPGTLESLIVRLVASGDDSEFFFQEVEDGGRWGEQSPEYGGAQMIDAATTLTMVNTDVPIITERQARALGQVVKEHGAEAAPSRREGRAAVR